MGDVYNFILVLIVFIGVVGLWWIWDRARFGD